MSPAEKRDLCTLFIESTIHNVAKNGMENLRTKDVAAYAGYSEATLFRYYENKETLLRETFLYLDEKVSCKLTGSRHILHPDNASFEVLVHDVWSEIYDYLVSQPEETLYLIRFRYSSQYTDAVRAMRSAYNGKCDGAYAVIAEKLPSGIFPGRSFLINQIFEITLCYAEKIALGRLPNTEATRELVWCLVKGVMASLLKLS